LDEPCNPGFLPNAYHQEKIMKLKTLIATLALCSTALYAQTVEVKEAWVHTSVPGQMSSSAYMKITAKAGVKLVDVFSPVAGVAEVHEMKMEDNVMKMRAVPALDLPAGKTVELKPGGYHVMLMDLKAPLKKDSTVPLTLVFKDAKGVQSRLALTVPVAASAPGAAMGGMTDHEHQHKH
jgi:periplasmic copper chaperone A